MSLPGKLISVDGTRVFVHRSNPRAGRRTPIVLVHGFLVSHWEWRHVVPVLADAGHDVVTFDLPGFGESDRPPVASFHYDAEAYLGTVTGVLDALEIPRATLCGHSLGAAISLFTAANRPERVERLVLVDPLSYKFHMPLEARVVLAPIIGPAIFRAVYSRALIRHVMRRDIYRDPALASDEWVDYVWERVNRPGGIDAAHAALLTCNKPAQFTSAARAVRAPTLIVWGEEDKLFPSVWARRLAAEVPGAEVRIVPACGHSPPEERPGEFLRALLPFLGARDGQEWKATA